jgi:serine protease Do
LAIGIVVAGRVLAEEPASVPPAKPVSPAAKTAEGGSPAIAYAKMLSKAFHEAAQKVLPAVVHIRNIPLPAGLAAGSAASANEHADQPMMPDPRHAFPQQGMAGSGVMIDPSGVILTANHVVENPGKITVRLQDGREFEAKDIRHDERTELAIICLKGAGAVTAAKLGNSDDMQVGEWVLALGDPFGLEGTVTAGIVSATGRGLAGPPFTDKMLLQNLLQTDAAINPGNSGGPLINLDGEVIGINTAIKSTAAGNPGAPPGNIGIGFAIPSATAKWASQELIAHGKVRRAYLGVVILPVTADVAERVGVAVGKGIMVREFVHDAPAIGAGVKPGDVIVEFGGKPVGNPQQLQFFVEQGPIGRTEPMVVVRNRKRMTLRVTLREQPPGYGLAQLQQPIPAQAQPTPGQALPQSPVREVMHQETLGVDVANLTAEIARKLGVEVDAGVEITGVKPDSPAQRQKLAAGMLVMQANRKPIKSIDDFRAAMADQPLSKGILLMIRTEQGATRLVIIKSP